MRALLLACVLALLTPVLARAETYFMLVGSEARSFDQPPLVRKDRRDYVIGAAVGLRERDPRFAAGDLLAGGTATYVKLTAAEAEGYRLSFNPLHNLLQLSGKVERLDFNANTGVLELRAATPIAVRGAQDPDDQSLVTLTIEGGYIADETPRDFPAAKLVTRLSFKAQPELGRSFIYARQPGRVGFALSGSGSEAAVHFGNFVSIADVRKSASGELAVTLQAGSKVTPRTQLLDSPPRLVVDLPGAKVLGQGQSYKGQGKAASVQLKAGADGARLTIALSARLDFRVLGSDGGARQQVQLLPYSAGAASRRAGRAIVIDRGHGGSDVGAIGVKGGIYEKTLNDQISKRLAAELKRLGYTVLETRTDDRWVSLGARADYANLLLPWLFVSVHCNSFDPAHQGVIVFVHPEASQASRQAARLVHDEFVAATQAPTKGVRDSDYFVLRETVMPSILVECGFMSNAEECGRLCDPAYQQKMAVGMARGIDRFVTGQ
jgi:N-acetylmuramoyl-L-alanine amidase